MNIDYSNPLLMKLRRAGQQLGFLRPMVRLYRRTFSLAYEEKFDAEILRRIRPGDVVWDVGANVGHFTRKFAAKAGAAGKVIAFEPSPATFAILRSHCKDLGNVEFVHAALAERDGKAEFVESEDEGDPTNGLRKPGDKGRKVEVPVHRGDTVCADNPEITPVCVKIDVEGFENDVLQGLSATLRRPIVRNVFVEVHFLELARRGLADAPANITALLSDCGFQVRWVDPSHLVASRDAH
jgi:FkbM family methyltransferase